ncbi:Do/DeqQ family serine protease [Oceanicella actignis]|uniref:Do/DeqQ family serine protease n=2 Tax=Oceanicella actignis TaxID=1189325 RepID=A0A1M7TLB5_9RHOB|nr:Do family serine endopeptidase [Oceanicella actignis]SET69242.1 Do/DeqQ family serine protease [Oceanicella actignis]SHN71438.1 Do/DeqQ family serine protease [Oceanicella actignis]
MNDMARNLRRAGAALAFAALAAGVWAGPAAAERKAPGDRAQIQLSFAPVVRRAAPAVVNIYARKLVERRLSPFAGDPFFERLFGDLMPRGRRVENSLGSGVILRPNGLVVSNHHVVGGASEIRVVLQDGREFDAEVILDDQQSDLAVLRLAGARGLPALELRDSDALEVGDLVLAIGNPFGVGQTVTSGIVSGLARSARDGRGYFIQTDAAINPGNSGGALVDMSGRLVGINTMILSRSGGSNGIGFAIPAELVRQAVMQAEQGRSALMRPWSGIEVQPLDETLAEALGLDRPRGLLVERAHPLSPFAKAGLRRGDVIVRVAGGQVSSPAELEFRLAARGVGATAEVVWLRDGKRRKARLRLIAAPEEPPRDPHRLGGDGPLAGLEVINLNPAAAEEMGLPSTLEGVAVVGAPPGALALGFRPGDVILAVNGRKVATTRELERIAREPARGWRIDILRDGRAGALVFRG